MYHCILRCCCFNDVLHKKYKQKFNVRDILRMLLYSILIETLYITVYACKYIRN